ncbi:GspH/FimT family protein [Thalassolituus sp. C2-1]|uniref:GspH/FimT family pseudopilin n=1 Tax=Venatorbacter sp. C2-1 TaxID=2597518 RepID=UPI00118FC603|nr:GspH/FimT family protein [Thalassolituus sp. C2-1]TVV42630.1 hypothetical protein FOT50_14220 [Thalassolituus sp. C2-1]
MHNNQHIKAFTLIESLTTLMLTSLLLGAGVPAFNSFLQRMSAEQDISQLRFSIQFARSSAVKYMTPTTLCPLNNTNQCAVDWNSELTMFLDKNSNRQLDQGEVILLRLPAVIAGTVLRTFNGSVIHFNASGFAGFHTGSFGYCAHGSRPTGATFIISRNGSVRPGQDKDGDGLPETANGKNVACPAR